MKFTWIRATTSQVVSPNPAMIGSVIVTPNSDSKKTFVTFYDGESTSDPEIVTIRTSSGTSQAVNFQPYMETKRGLYLVAGGDLGEVLIQLLWKEE